MGVRDATAPGPRLVSGRPAPCGAGPRGHPARSSPRRRFGSGRRCPQAQGGGRDCAHAAVGGRVAPPHPMLTREPGRDRQRGPWPPACGERTPCRPGSAGGDGTACIGPEQGLQAAPPQPRPSCGPGTCQHVLAMIVAATLPVRSLAPDPGGVRAPVAPEGATGPRGGPDGWVVPPSGDHTERSSRRVVARRWACWWRYPRWPRLRVRSRLMVALVGAELTSDGGLGQAACPERINLASFGSGQRVGRDGMTVAGWSCRDGGSHRAPWHRPRRATEPVRTGRTGSAASVALPSGTGETIPTATSDDIDLNAFRAFMKSQGKQMDTGPQPNIEHDLQNASVCDWLDTVLRPTLYGLMVVTVQVLVWSFRPARQLRTFQAAG